MKYPVTILAFLLTALTCHSQAWTKLTDIPEKLAFPVVVVLGTEIHVIGGGAPSGATGLHLRYKTATDTWDTLAPVPYMAQQPAGAAANGKIHYFGGGFPNSGTPLNKHYVYTPGTDSWDTAAVIPVNRVIHKAAVLGDSIYVLGGQPDKLRFERYDPAGNTWKKLNNLPDQDFWYGAIVVHNDTMYRFGGGGYGAPSNKAHRYDVATDSWVSLPNLPGSRHAIAGDAIGDSIYLLGGYTFGSVSDQLWIYNTYDQTYVTSFAMPDPRIYHSVVTVGECLYSLGGNDLDTELEVLRHCRGDSADFTGISEAKAKSFSVYPNPVTDKITISNVQFPKELELINHSGKKLMVGILDEKIMTIDVSKFPRGLYILKVGEETKRVLLQ